MKQDTTKERKKRRGNVYFSDVLFVKHRKWIL